MPRTLKILFVHGLGDHRQSDWKITWPKAIKSVFPRTDGLEQEYVFCTYDDIFQTVKLSLAMTIKALAMLTSSRMTSIFPRQRALSGISETIRWYAGYVVAWVADEEFKRKSRQRILDEVRKHQPDVVVAHSLGSLITYDAFSHPDAGQPDVAPLLARATYVTLGSQINNPFVIKNLSNGRVQQPPVAFWHHLYNENDHVFTAPIDNWADGSKFKQTETPFGGGAEDPHAATGYLTHHATAANVWRTIGAAAVGARSFGPGPQDSSRLRIDDREPVRRAFLVGINDYPDPTNRLEGCINDVFLMSMVLQECGFPPETIRTCLDSRATADSILMGLRWLLDEVHPNDELVFYYSGHGTRFPDYGEAFQPDHFVECLVPYDFNWSPETCITDKQINSLYSQLPYKTRLAMIFDCCHSGGMHRNGAARARGLTPPDDIRHRALKWDRETEMWVPRDFHPLNAEFADHGDAEVMTRYFGPDGATVRLGRAGMLRGLDAEKFAKVKRTASETTQGPFLPLIIEACGPDQLSYEYRHGATSYGAFTYSIANIMRKEKSLTFETLVEKTRRKLQLLQYKQVPQILGPTNIMKAHVPWLAPAPSQPQPGAAKRQRKAA